ncbi:Radixin [Fasciola hepatica]|uniref:Radixin n=1 Tax=Fasciola hepatica TaxID=6192 RepID=A0A4E0RIG3_FASHE|nr:Radixin [Fasciola hepatica]
MKWNKGPTKKLLRIKVTSHESELEFNISPKSTGKYLFDLVCSTIGLRETWYFGLQSYSLLPNGRMRLAQWLKLDKKIVSQRANATQKQLCFFFHTKFFPEDIEQELIQATTRHLFYLSVKATILNRNETDFNGTFSGDLCPSLDVAIVLASLAAQAEYGDLCEDELDDKDDPNFLPTRLLRLIPVQLVQHVQTNQVLAQKLRECYKSYKGINRDKAELQYLKLAQTHHLFGVDFFPIVCVRMKCPRALSLARYLTRNELTAWHGWDKHHTNAWLGVTAAGIQLYGKNRRERPRYTFQWNIIKNVSYRERKFTVKLIAGWRFPHKSCQPPVAVTSTTLGASCVETFPSGSRPRQSSRSTGGRSPLVSATGPTLTVGLGAGGSNLSATSLPSTPLSARLALPASSPMGNSGLGSPSNLAASSWTQRDMSYERVARRSGQSPTTMKSSGRMLDFDSGCIPSLTPISTRCSANELPIIGGVGCLAAPRIQTTDSSGAASSSLSSKSSFTPLHHRPSNELLINVVEVWLADPTQAKTVMTMCAGNHALFMRRRQPDSVEVQQMRAQAREERARREIERSRLARARAEKAEAIDAKQALETRCAQLEQALRHQQELQRAYLSGGLDSSREVHQPRIRSQQGTEHEGIEHDALKLRTPQPPRITRRSLRLSTTSGVPPDQSKSPNTDAFLSSQAEVDCSEQQLNAPVENDPKSDDEHNPELDNAPGSSDIQFGDCIFYPPDHDDVDELDYSEYVRWDGGDGGINHGDQFPLVYPSASTYDSRHFGTQQLRSTFHRATSGTYRGGGGGVGIGGSASTPATPFVRRALFSMDDSAAVKQNSFVTPQMSRRRLTITNPYTAEVTELNATPKIPYSAHFAGYFASHPSYYHSAMWTPCCPDQQSSGRVKVCHNDPGYGWDPNVDKRSHPYIASRYPQFPTHACPTTVGSMPAMLNETHLTSDSNAYLFDEMWPAYPIRSGHPIPLARATQPGLLACGSCYTCGPNPSLSVPTTDYCTESQRRPIAPGFDTPERWCNQPGALVHPSMFSTCGTRNDHLSSSLSAILSPVAGSRWQHLQQQQQRAKHTRNNITNLLDSGLSHADRYPHHHLSRHMSCRSVRPAPPVQSVATGPMLSTAVPLTRSTSQIFPLTESFPSGFHNPPACSFLRPSMHSCVRPTGTVGSRRQSLQQLINPAHADLSPPEYIPNHPGYCMPTTPVQSLPQLPLRRAASIGESAWAGDMMGYTVYAPPPPIPPPSLPCHYQSQVPFTSELSYHPNTQLNPAQRGYLSSRLQEERARFAMLQAQFSKQLSDTWACLQVTRSPGGIKPPPPNLYSGSPLHNTSSLNNELRLDPAGASDGASTGGGVAAGGTNGGSIGVGVSGGGGSSSGAPSGYLGCDSLCGVPDTGTGMHHPGPEQAILAGSTACDHSDSTGSIDGLARGSAVYANQSQLHLIECPPTSASAICDQHGPALTHYGSPWCPDVSSTNCLDSGRHLHHTCPYCVPGNALLQSSQALID